MGLMDFILGAPLQNYYGYELDPQAQDAARRQAMLALGSSLLGTEAIADPGGAIGRGMAQGSSVLQQGLGQSVEIQRRRQLDEERRREAESEQAHRAEILKLHQSRESREKELFDIEKEERQSFKVNFGELMERFSGSANPEIQHKIGLAQAAAQSGMRGEAMGILLDAIKEERQAARAARVLSKIKLGDNLERWRPLLEEGEMTSGEIISLMIQSQNTIRQNARLDKQMQIGIAQFLAEQDAKYELVEGTGVYDDSGNLIDGEFKKSFPGSRQFPYYMGLASRYLNGEPLESVIPGGDGGAGVVDRPKSASEQAAMHAKDALMEAGGEPLKALHIVASSPAETEEDAEIQRMTMAFIRQSAGGKGKLSAKSERPKGPFKGTLSYLPESMEESLSSEGVLMFKDDGVAPGTERVVNGVVMVKQPDGSWQAKRSESYIFGR